MTHQGTNANAVPDANGKAKTSPAFASILGVGYGRTGSWSSDGGPIAKKDGVIYKNTL